MQNLQTASSRQLTPDPKRILIVEDESIVAIDLSMQLEALGYQIAGIANTPAGALALAAEATPDLVLMDIQLQDEMSGTSLATQLHREFKLPIVFLTAFTEDAIIDQVSQADPFGFIVKPFEIRELKAVVRMALDRVENQARYQEMLETLRRSEENYRNLFTDAKQAKEDLRRHQDHLEEIVKARTEELLRVNASQRKLWRAIENSPSSVVITDQNGVIEYVNPRFCQLSEYSLEEALGQNPRVLKSGMHPPAFYKELWNCVLAGNTWRGEICNKSKNGRVYWEQVSISPVRDGHGEITNFVAIKEDITENKKVAEELRRAKEAAEAANRAKSVFLANMSHEIRTPMNAILGFSQLLRQDPAVTPQQRQYLDIINRSGEHLLSLINDVLEMSKIEAGRVKLNPSTFDIFALLANLESMFRIRAEGKGLKLKLVFHVDSGIPHYLIGDEGKLRQILINLLSNAVKFTESGSVTLRIFTTPSTSASLRLIALVEDTGPGISPEETNLLFRSFEQTASGRQAGTGTGLGLVISREFARLMGGDISVHSQLGLGSVFRLEIDVSHPIESDAPPEQNTRKRVLGLMPGETSRKILVIDDSPDTRLLLCEVLKSVGFELAQAEDGAEGLALFNSWKPHLILTDMRMPVMDGFELTRRIRATGSKVKIISLSAGAFEEDRQNALAAGVDAFLGKPFRADQVFEMIRAQLAIGYVYASDPSGAISPNQRTAVEQTDLSSLPPELVEQMRNAIKQADLDHLLECISKASAHNSQIAQTLSGFANQYNYRALATYLGIQDAN